MRENTSREKELAQNTLIITIGRASTQFITFLLLPLYTSILTKEEYGVVDFVTVLAQLIVPVISLMIDQGAFRLLLTCITEKQKKEVISSAVWTLVISIGISLIIYFVFNPFFSFDYKLWTVFIIILNSISNLTLQLARGLKKTRNYAIASFLLSGITLICNVILIAFFHFGAIGMLIAVAVGYLISSIFLFINLRIWKYLSFASFNREIVFEELKYSIPLIPNQLSLWVMNGSDRIIVTHFLGVAANGIMAISHKFPSLFSFFYHIFQLAWHETGTVHYNDEDRDDFFSDMINKSLSIFSTLCMWVIIALPVIFPLLVNKSYRDAYYNIPIYMIASLLNIALGLLGVIYVATKKTAEISKTTFIAAIINIIVNIGLIRFIGLYASSISTLVGYLVTLLYRVHDTKKYISIRYNKTQLTKIGIGLLSSCIIYYLNNPFFSLLIIPLFFGVGYYYNKTIIDSLFIIIKKKTEKNVSKKFLIVSIGIILAIYYLVVGVYEYYKHNNTPPHIENVNNIQIYEVKPEKRVLFSEFGESDFTCTGLTFDTTDNSFWIADSGYQKDDSRYNPKIIETDIEFTTVLKEIELTCLSKNEYSIQGITYDNQNDTIWVAAGDSIIEFDKFGNFVNEISLKEFSRYKANGICFDEKNNSIWVLCASKYIFNVSKDGEIINTIDFNYAYQDHIVKIDDSLFITVGADYSGNNNYVCRLSIDKHDIESIFSTRDAYAIEGICKQGNNILIANDGLYHNALINSSYITIYNYDNFKISNRSAYVNNLPGYE